MDALAIISIGGLPGAGKTTQSSRLAEATGGRLFVAGKYLRDEAKRQTELGETFYRYSSLGLPCPDEVICAILRDPLDRALSANDGIVLLDGFPKSGQQLDFLEGRSAVPLTALLYLEVPTEELVARLTRRRTCEQCGMASDLESATCQSCGARIRQRYDDSRRIVEQRLLNYRDREEKFKALMSGRGRALHVDGSRTSDIVHREFVDVCEAITSGSFPPAG
ncbi:nucleoside monophosphate kinase [Actinomadura sp. GTD37]|uniref:nucleoside monophosphate kinase n=1 Tax=Actinomadura sp. GTD37 TaxID=1778030 RepID=UPI0035C1720C